VTTKRICVCGHTEEEHGGDEQLVAAGLLEPDLVGCCAYCGCRKLKLDPDATREAQEMEDLLNQINGDDKT
jgi:hypothetical protein